jgi:hypothetical protein
MDKHFSSIVSLRHSILIALVVIGIVSLIPHRVQAQADTVTIIGSNFLPTTQVRMNGALLVSRFVSSTEIRAAVPSGTPLGTYPITVINTGPGGGTSQTQTLNISAANTGNIAFVTSYKIQTQTYMEPRGTVLGKDIAFMPSWRMPQNINQTMTTTVFPNGGFQTEIIDNDVAAPIGSAITRPKRILISTQDSSITSFDVNNQSLRSTRASFLPSFRKVIQNLQSASENSTSGTILAGLSAVPGSPTAVLEYINRLRNSTPPIIPDTEDAGYATFTLSNTTGGDNQIPTNAVAKILLNKTNNTIETAELLVDNNVVAKTFFKYKAVTNQSQQPILIFDTILTEGYYNTPDNTPMKSVLAMQFQDITFNNYVRCIPRN